MHVKIVFSPQRWVRNFRCGGRVVHTLCSCQSTTLICMHVRRCTWKTADHIKEYLSTTINYNTSLTKEIIFEFNRFQWWTINENYFIIYDWFVAILGIMYGTSDFWVTVMYLQSTGMKYLTHSYSNVNIWIYKTLILGDCQFSPYRFWYTEYKYADDTTLLVPEHTDINIDVEFTPCPQKRDQ